MKSVFGKQDTQMTGCYVTVAEAEHLSLLAVCEDASRSKILGGLIRKHIEAHPASAAVQVIARRALKLWTTKQADLTYEQFRRGMTRYLLARKVSAPHAEAVLREVRALYQKERG